MISKMMPRNYSWNFPVKSITTVAQNYLDGSHYFETYRLNDLDLYFNYLLSYRLGNTSFYAQNVLEAMKDVIIKESPISIIMVPYSVLMAGIADQAFIKIATQYIEDKVNTFCKAQSYFLRSFDSKDPTSVLAYYIDEEPLYKVSSIYQHFLQLRMSMSQKERKGLGKKLQAYCNKVISDFISTMWTYAIISNDFSKVRTLAEPINNLLPILLKHTETIDEDVEDLRLLTNLYIKDCMGSNTNDLITFSKTLQIQSGHPNMYPLRHKIRRILERNGQAVNRSDGLFIGETVKTKRGILVTDVADYYVDTLKNTKEAEMRKAITSKSGKEYVELDYYSLFKTLNPTSIQKDKKRLEIIERIILN